LFVTHIVQHQRCFNLLRRQGTCNCKERFVTVPKKYVGAYCIRPNENKQCLVGANLRVRPKCTRHENMTQKHQHNGGVCNTPLRFAFALPAPQVQIKTDNVRKKYKPPAKVSLKNHV